MKNWSKYALVITFVWIGMIMGISFLEAPLKFQAPNITLALGLGIGRLVFAALNKFEIAFMIILALAAWRGNYSFPARFIVSFIAAILAVQTFYLLPLLGERTLQIIAGNSVPDTPHHYSYIILEVCKIALLIWLGMKQLKTLGSSTGKQV